MQIARLIIFLFILPCLAHAQKKELSQARTYLKNSKFDDAEKLMKGLLKDTANLKDKRVYLLWYEAVRGKYEQGNEKLYLRQKYDTATFFGYTRQLFSILETLDSLDMRPDRKGRVAPEYREKHAAWLNSIRPNLFNGGTYFVRKADWKRAFDYFETYIDCARQPIFSGYALDSTDQRRPEAAYWATYSAYRQKDPVLTLRYRKLALRDTLRADFTLQYMAEARRWLNDEELYLATLQEGFRRFPQFPYFFPRLIDVYTSHGQYERALAVADSALAVNDSSQLFLFAKSSALLRLKRYRECIDYSTRLIATNDSLPEPYFNAATAYLALAEGMNPRKDKRLVKSAYQNARFFMERYRELMPAEQQKWAPALYRIYLNLNLGKQFDEIDHLLNKSKGDA